MFRRLLLSAAGNERLRSFATSNRIASDQARRFVAGETLDEAMTAAQSLVDAGRWVSLDHVGEEVSSPSDAIAAADHYVHALGELAAAGLAGRVGVSVKPTQIGLRIDAGLCRDQVARIAAASDAASHVTLDMEDHTVTDATLDLVESMHAEGHTNVGCAVQVMLHRTRDDVVRMVEQDVSLRLCKGAYAEPSDHALQDATRIRDRYLQLAEVMLTGGGLARFATHDHDIIDALVGHDADFEVQLLHGVREPLQESLIESGQRTLVYLPYGDEWYPYFVRRLAERPANLLFFARAMAGSR